MTRLRTVQLGPQRALGTKRYGGNVMHYMVELAIEREAAILDEQLDLSDILELAPAPWDSAEGRLNSHTRKFSPRGSSGRRATTSTATTRYHYAN